MASTLNRQTLKQYFDEQPANEHAKLTEMQRFRDDIIRLLGKVKLKTITGTLTVASLAIGSSVDVSVNHSSSAAFRFCEYPRFTAVNGVEVEVFGMIDIDGTSYSTSGSLWVARISNISLSSYFPAVNITWSRVGML